MLGKERKINIDMSIQIETRPQPENKTIFSTMKIEPKADFAIDVQHYIVGEFLTLTALAQLKLPSMKIIRDLRAVSDILLAH